MHYLTKSWCSGHVGHQLEIDRLEYIVEVKTPMDAHDHREIEDSSVEDLVGLNVGRKTFARNLYTANVIRKLKLVFSLTPMLVMGVPDIFGLLSEIFRRFSCTLGAFQYEIICCK